MGHAQEQGISERRACRLVDQSRGTRRYRAARREDEDALTQAIVELASQYGLYGYRRITALLQRDGWQVGGGAHLAPRRAEGSAEAKAAWTGCGSTMDREYGCGQSMGTQVRTYDFVSTRTHDGRTVRVLNLIDEYRRECLMMRAERRWSSAKVIEVLADAIVMKGIPVHLRSDSGPEFVAKDLTTPPTVTIAIHKLAALH